MPVSKNRPEHKAKLAQRNLKIAQSQLSWTKHLQKLLADRGLRASSK